MYIHTIQQLLDILWQGNIDFFNLPASNKNNLRTYRCFAWHSCAGLNFSVGRKAEQQKSSMHSSHLKMKCVFHIINGQGAAPGQKQKYHQEAG